MEVVKLKKSLLNKQWVDILTELGAVDKKLNQAFPSSVYMSAEDIKHVRANTKAKLKKQFSYASKKVIVYSEAMDFLNLGASSRLELAIKPGYALVDRTEIEREINEMKNWKDV